MSRRRYRRNGTPIGEYKVYALVFKRWAEVYEIVPQGIETYEDLEVLVEMEAMAGKFGFDFSRIVITKPGVYLEEANLIGVKIPGCNLSGANLSLCDLDEADLDHCNLSGANLEEAVLHRASMNFVNLSGAKTRRAEFHGVIMNFGNTPPGWRRDAATGTLFDPSWRPTE